MSRGRHQILPMSMPRGNNESSRIHDDRMHNTSNSPKIVHM